jgi:alpha-tubulin suppressor-like RCC1 family protein
LKCWGHGGYGELGNGTTTSYTVPVSVTNISTAKAVFGGEYAFCARLLTGALDCWGNGSDGQLGDGSNSGSDVPAGVRGITNATGVTSGNYNFCARLSTGGLDCWGNGFNGQLGDGSGNNSDVPVPVAKITGVKAVSNSGSSVCAVLSSGNVDCWGYNGSGQLGDGTTANSDVPVTVLGITNATAVAGNIVGGSFCAVLSTGQLKCWGFNGFGELGNGTTTSFTVPVSVEHISTAASLIGGNNDFCGLLSSEHLECWGNGAWGQLGDASFAGISDIPVAVHSISNATTMISGYEAFCGLLSTRHVDCWGDGYGGMLGDGSFTNSDVPVPVRATS